METCNVCAIKFVEISSVFRQHLLDGTFLLMTTDKTALCVRNYVTQIRHVRYNSEWKITVDWSRLTWSKLTIAHGNGGEPRRKNTSWTSPFKMGRRDKERREIFKRRSRLRAANKNDCCVPGGRKRPRRRSRRRKRRIWRVRDFVNALIKLSCIPSSFEMYAV